MVTVSNGEHKEILEQIGEVKTSVAVLETKIDNIYSNCIPSLTRNIEEVSANQIQLRNIMITTIGGLTTALILIIIDIAIRL